MINAADFVIYLKAQKIDFFVGVPDSLLKDLIAHIDNTADKGKYLITANEGNAIAVASGYNLATGKLPVVFMQNSGLGNCINPLTSLTNKEVYKVPMILLIGWRGEPHSNDEPQHKLPGKILQDQLDLIDIPNFIIDSDTNFSKVIDNAINKIKLIQSPVALIFKKNTFNKNVKQESQNTEKSFTRRKAIENIILGSNKKDLILSTTGKASRELYEIRKNHEDNVKDFMTVGSMGHISSIALGVDIGKKDNKKNIICIDGDGSCLMHMGAIAILGCNKSHNMKYFLLNNGSHDSVGGQKTVGLQIDFSMIAKACNFQHVFKCRNENELKYVINSDEYKNNAAFIEVIIEIGDSENLIRPKEKAIENKHSFIKFLQS